MENRGQWNTPARFVAREGRITAFFEERAITLHATGEASPALRFAFEGASSRVRPVGDGTAGGRYNFHISNDSFRWRTDVRGYDRLMYRGLYDGIDLVVRDEGRLLEYDLLLASPADLDRVVIAAEGASALEIAADGALVMHTRAGPLRQTAPRTWEVLPDGTRRPIASRFHLLAGAMSATFPINTSAVTALSRVTIVGTVGGIGNQGTFTLMPVAAPKPALITFAPRMVTGGTSATGTVTLNTAAPSGGTVLSLESSHPGAGSVPASVTVPAGLNSTSFPVTTFPVSVEVDLQITARSAGEQWTGALYVRPPGLPTLTGMTVSPASVAGGSDLGGTLTFSGPIRLGRWPAYQDGFVRISSSDPDAAAVFPTDEFRARRRDEP